MAGNTVEWSTETSSYNGTPCVYRGGYYDNVTYSPSYRNGYDVETGSHKYFSCRPVLYLE